MSTPTSSTVDESSDKVFRFISDPDHKENLSGRVRAACLTCRRKKIKCSGEFNCATCQEKGVVCEGPPERKRSRRDTARPSTSKSVGSGTERRRKSDTWKYHTKSEDAARINGSIRVWMPGKATSEHYQRSATARRMRRSLSSASTSDASLSKATFETLCTTFDIEHAVWDKNDTPAQLDNLEDPQATSLPSDDVGVEPLRDVTGASQASCNWWPNVPSGSCLMSAAIALDQHAHSLGTLRRLAEEDIYGTDWSTRRRTVALPLPTSKGLEAMPDTPSGQYISFADLALSFAERTSKSSATSNLTSMSSWWTDGLAVSAIEKEVPGGLYEGGIYDARTTRAWSPAVTAITELSDQNFVWC